MGLYQFLVQGEKSAIPVLPIFTRQPGIYSLYGLFGKLQFKTHTPKSVELINHSKKKSNYATMWAHMLKKDDKAMEQK